MEQSGWQSTTSAQSNGKFARQLCNGTSASASTVTTASQGFLDEHSHPFSQMIWQVNNLQISYEKLLTRLFYGSSWDKVEARLV